MKPIPPHTLLFLFLCGMFQACSPGNIVYYTFSEFPSGEPIAAPNTPYIVNHTMPTDSTKGYAWYNFEGETVFLEDQTDYPLRIVSGTDLPGKALRYFCENPIGYSDVRMSFIAEAPTSIQTSDSISFSWMGIPHISGFGNRDFHIGGNLKFPNNKGKAAVFNLRITNNQFQLGEWDGNELEYQSIGPAAVDELHLVGVLLDLGAQTYDLRIETVNGAIELSGIEMLSAGMENPSLSTSRPTLQYYWETESYNSGTYYTLDQVRIHKKN